MSDKWFKGLFIPDGVNPLLFLTYCSPQSCKVELYFLFCRLGHRDRVVNLSRITHPASDEAKIWIQTCLMLKPWLQNYSASIWELALQCWNGTHASGFTIKVLGELLSSCWSFLVLWSNTGLREAGKTKLGPPAALKKSSRKNYRDLHTIKILWKNLVFLF